MSSIKSEVARVLMLCLLSEPTGVLLLDFFFFLCAVVCTVESLPLFYLIFISRFVLGDDTSIS